MDDFSEAPWCDKGLELRARRQRRRGKAVLTTQHTGRKEVTVVAATAAPGTPARRVTLLQNELLSLEVGVFIHHPTGER